MINRIPKSYTVTCNDLLNDKWSWAVAYRFNRTYNLKLTHDEILSELGYMYSWVLREMNKGRVKFTFDDYVQVFKYFRFAVRNQFCDLAHNKKKELKVVQLSDYNFDILEGNKCSGIPNYEVIRSVTDETIFNYVLKLAGSPKEKIQTVYEKFGKKGVKLIVKCKWALNIRERRSKMDTKIVILTQPEIEWLKQCMIKNNQDTSDASNIVKYASTQEGAFWKRIIKWVGDGLKVSEREDCFSYGFDKNVVTCQTCVVAPDCKIACDWRLGTSVEKLVDVKGKQTVEPPVVVPMDKKQVVIGKESPIKNVVTRQKTSWVTNTKPKLYISSLKKEPYYVTCSSRIVDWLKAHNISYVEHKDHNIGCHLTSEHILELVELFKIKK